MHQDFGLSFESGLLLRDASPAGNIHQGADLWRCWEWSAILYYLFMTFDWNIQATSSHQLLLGWFLFVGIVGFCISRRQIRTRCQEMKSSRDSWCKTCLNLRNIIKFFGVWQFWLFPGSTFLVLHSCSLEFKPDILKVPIFKGVLKGNSEQDVRRWIPARTAHIRLVWIYKTYST